MRHSTPTQQWQGNMDIPRLLLLLWGYWILQNFFLIKTTVHSKYNRIQHNCIKYNWKPRRVCKDKIQPFSGIPVNIYRTFKKMNRGICRDLHTRFLRVEPRNFHFQKFSKPGPGKDAPTISTLSDEEVNIREAERLPRDSPTSLGWGGLNPHRPWVAE